MKKCPQCGREYDPSMMFCLDDGAELLYGPSSDEPATAFLEAEPRTILVDSTERQSLSAHRAAQPQEQSGRATFDKRLLLAPIALAVIVLAGFAGYRYL